MPRNISSGYFALRWEVLKRDAFTCQYCGRSAPDVKLEVDHIIPVSEGGTDTKDNLITACYSCNRGKSALSLRDKFTGMSRTFVKRINRQIQVLELLESNPLTSVEIMKALSITRGYADMIIKRLRDKGEIWKMDDGGWKRSKRGMLRIKYFQKKAAKSLI